MRPEPGAARAASDSEDAQLISDLFHALNQPLTALRCGIELSLRGERSAEQYREALQAAGLQAERIAGWVIGIRALLEAVDPGDDWQVLALGDFLREAAADLQPLAEARQLRLAWRGDAAGGVLFERQRLRQALSGLLEWALVASPAGATLEIGSHAHAGEIVIALAVIAPMAMAQPRESAESSLRRRLGIAIPQRILQAAGGSLRIEELHSGFRIEVRLPVAAVPA